MPRSSNTRENQGAKSTAERVRNTAVAAKSAAENTVASVVGSCKGIRENGLKKAKREAKEAGDAFKYSHPLLGFVANGVGAVSGFKSAAKEGARAEKQRRQTGNGVPQLTSGSGSSRQRSGTSRGNGRR